MFAQWSSDRREGRSPADPVYRCIRSQRFGVIVETRSGDGAPPFCLFCMTALVSFACRPLSCVWGDASARLHSNLGILTTFTRIRLQILTCQGTKSVFPIADILVFSAAGEKDWKWNWDFPLWIKCCFMLVPFRTCMYHEALRFVTSFKSPHTSSFAVWTCLMGSLVFT